VINISEIGSVIMVNPKEEEVLAVLDKRIEDILKGLSPKIFRFINWKKLNNFKIQLYTIKAGEFFHIVTKRPAIVVLKNKLTGKYVIADEYTEYEVE